MDTEALIRLAMSELGKRSGIARQGKVWSSDEKAAFAARGTKGMASRWAGHVKGSACCTCPACSKKIKKGV